MKPLAKKLKQGWEKTLFWVCALVFLLVLVMWFMGFGKSGRALVSKKTAPPRRSLLNPTALAFLDEIPAPDLEGNNPFAFEIEEKQEEKKGKWPWQKTKRKPNRWQPKPKKPETPAKPVVKPAPRPAPTPKPAPKPAVVEKPVETPKPAPKPAVVEKPVETPKPAPTPTPKPAPKPAVVEKPVETPKPAPKPVDPPKPKPKPKPPSIRIVEYRGTMTTTSGERVALVQTKDPVSKKEALRFVKKGGKLLGVEISDFTEDALKVRDSKGRSRSIAFGEQQKIVTE